MKNLLTVIIISSVTLSFTSCGNSDEEKEKEVVDNKSICECFNLQFKGLAKKDKACDYVEEMDPKEYDAAIQDCELER